MKPIYAKPPWGSRAAFQVRKDYFDLLDTRWHYHSEYELAFIKYPHGKRIAGKSIGMFEDSDLVFYGPNIPHSWSHELFSDRSDLQQHNAGLSHYAIVVHFTESCFGETFFSIPEMNTVQALLTKSTCGLVVHGASKTKVADWMEQMVTETGSKRVVLLLQILEELTTAREISLLSSSGYWDNLNDHDAIRMSSIYEYLIRNFTKDISLNEIAEHAHMSPSAFCRYFKSRTKRTLKEFVNELRVNSACQLLEENRSSITQICFEVGFNNISNFNRRFKEVRGITPQQYRFNILGVHHKNNI